MVPLPDASSGSIIRSMDINPDTLRPIGDKVVLKMEPYPEEIGGIKITGHTAKVVPCKVCKGEGCRYWPIYEEDGIKIAHHAEEMCPSCKGSGRSSKFYDPRFRLFERIGRVVSVGPGVVPRKIRYSDWKTLWWKRGFIPTVVTVGDRVVVAKWAGNSGESFYLDEEKTSMIVREKEILAILPRGPEPDPLPA